MTAGRRVAGRAKLGSEGPLLPLKRQTATELVFNRQRSVLLDLAALAVFAQRAAQICHKQKRPSGTVAGAEVPLVEISLVSDRRIAQVHRQFLQIRGATDVITFAHGEIVISVLAAQRGAREHGEPLERELGRYIVHGLLHLRGYNDTTPLARAAMWRVQENILRRLWAGTPRAEAKLRKPVPRR